ncbi:hypothetical protein [Halopelagius longus]|uniref:DUF7993 domain-containing protein n=1 Tax=Halopelagius longus TaxID=1236180 RepID=A0A1H0YBF8_9EURY|nr:hypothetical protein [Halopelagius longus]RDI72390.1 hypothetical protein DWB78_12070 [Halopelagius longus]SDQ12413.1 hypothetical protein SAMN05216278_0527 [Halopelagius longus]
MVEDRLTDGKRIAQFVASEVEGHEDLPLAVSDADPDVEPTEDGAFAYRIVRTEADGEGNAVAEVYVHPDRARAEFVTAVDVAAEAADAEGLRVRPKAVRPPRTLVFVEDGAQVKWLLPALRAVADA